MIKKLAPVLLLAACLIQWAKVFVEGADDALNKGYKHTSPGVSLTGKP